LERDFGPERPARLKTSTVAKGKLMPYRFLEDIATADVAFCAWGESLEDAFQAAADATLKVMVENTEQVQKKTGRKIYLENTELDLLLFDLLQELIYYKDTDELLLHVLDVSIEETPDRYRLSASAAGEILDPERHHLQVDVKAVTLHRFTLTQKNGKWMAQVILDI
jgi:SHS2 domain-containing protein